MGANLLLRVPDSLFNIAQLLKYMELAQRCFQGQRSSDPRRRFFQALPIRIVTSPR
jgi:hypothetical protein